MAVIIKNIRQNDIGSSKYIIPINTTPTIPMPDHIRYAVPKGICSRALHNKAKLIKLKITNNTIHPGLVSPLDNLRVTANKISKIPANIR